MRLLTTIKTHNHLNAHIAPHLHFLVIPVSGHVLVHRHTRASRPTHTFVIPVSDPAPSIRHNRIAPPHPLFVIPAKAGIHCPAGTTKKHRRGSAPVFYSVFLSQKPHFFKGLLRLFFAGQVHPDPCIGNCITNFFCA